MDRRKIAVLMGGTSNEREVSLESGANVAAALSGTGRYEVVPVKLDDDNLDALPEGVDAVYIALHGGWGENGGVQAALDARGIPYTGPGAAASRTAMDKIATKRALEQCGVPTAAWYVANGEAASDAPRLPLPVVVKAPRDGSSVGVYKCATREAYSRAVTAAVEIDARANGGAGEALVEAFIPGREATVAVVGDEIWPAIEIVAPGGWYGYEEKYRSNATGYVFLADGTAVDRALEARIGAIAREAAAALGCRGVCRVDFRIAEDLSPYVLELNTSPGFTAHSLVPKSGMRTGLTFAGVCERILGAAACDR